MTAVNGIAGEIYQLLSNREDEGPKCAYCSFDRDGKKKKRKKGQRETERERGKEKRSKMRKRHDMGKEGKEKRERQIQNERKGIRGERRHDIRKQGKMSSDREKQIQTDKDMTEKEIKGEGMSLSLIVYCHLNGDRMWLV